MELSGNYFTYDGTSSEQYGLYFCNYETSIQDLLVSDADQKVVNSKRYLKNYFVEDEFDDEGFQFEIDILGDELLSDDDQRIISRWLFHKPTYKKLYIDTDEECDDKWYVNENGNDVRLYMNVRFINPVRVYAGGVIGWHCVVVCDSSIPIWQEVSVAEFDTESTQNLTIDVNTDLTTGYVYPKVYITPSDTTVRIINRTDSASRYTTFVGVTVGQEFLLDGEINSVTDAGGNNNHYYELFQSRNFPRLLSGSNTIGLTGIQHIRFEWQNQHFA